MAQIASIRPRHLVAWLVLAAVSLGLGHLDPLRRATADDPPDKQTITEDIPTILKPLRARDEAREDLLTSGAHFAQARIFLQRGNRESALKHLQRAWLFNQDRIELLDRIVALASELGMHEQAARYAVLSAEQRPRNARLLIQLGGLLVQQEDAARGLQMYEKALALRGAADETPQTVAIRMEMGRLHYVNEDFKQAAKQFALVRDALDDPQILTAAQRKTLLPKPYGIYSLMAATFLADGRIDEAEKMCRKADSFAPNPAVLSYNLGEIALRKAAAPEARELLDAYLDSKSTDAGIEAYQVLRELCGLEHADPDDADAAYLAELSRRHQNDPDNVPLGYVLAKERLAKDQLDEARQLFTALLKQRATADGFVAMADICRRQQRVPELFTVLRQVVAQTESLDTLKDALAGIVADRALVTQLLRHAREKCQEPLAAERKTAALAAAYLAIEAEDLAEFDAFAEIAVEAAEDQNVQVLQQLGLAVFIGEDAQRAGRLFRRAVDEKPDDQTAGTLQFYLAGALQFAGDTDAALVAAARAGELRSDSARFLSRKPWIHYQAKHYELAEQHYRALIDQFGSTYDVPGVRDVLRETRLILSNIAVQRNQLAEAEEWLAQVLDEFPEDIGAKNDLGYLWADQGKHLRRALAMVQQAVESEPDNIAYRDSLGWAYFRLGRFADAVRELTVATAGDDPDGVILDHLGDAHLGENHPDQAVAVWERAISAFRKSEQVDRLPAIEAKIKKYSQE